MNHSSLRSRRGRLLLPAVAAVTASLALSMPASASDGQSTTTLRDKSSVSAKSLASTVAGSKAKISKAKVSGVDVQVGAAYGLPSDYFAQKNVALTTGSLIASDPQADSDVDFEYSSVLGPNQKLTTTGDLGGDGDDALTELAGADTYDAATLSFDVKATGSTLNLVYQFGSEEYAGEGGSGKGNPNHGSWESQGYGDVLSITVNGKECAYVPGTTDPVNASTINETTNSKYYTANISGHELGDIDTEMNGFTSKLTCSVPVTSGKKAHVRIAIADVDDGQLDSTVLLPAGGLTFSGKGASATPTASIEPTSSASESTAPKPTTSATAAASSTSAAEPTTAASASATSTPKSDDSGSSDSGNWFTRFLSAIRDAITALLGLFGIH